jgi:hypothetical protein
VNTEEITTLLVERAGAVDSNRPERVDEVFSRIRTHQRRRTGAAVAGASCVVMALVVGVALLSGQSPRSSDPVAPATSTPANPNPSAPVRRVTYADGYWPTTTIHYGDRSVDISEQLAFGRPGFGGISGVVHMDVTDDGVVFTTEGGGIWFTDGSSTHLIGETQGYLGIRAAAVVASGTTGSRVAWVAESSKPKRTEIVVYDTQVDREVRRVSVPDCADPLGSCELQGLIGDDHVYWALKDGTHARPDLLMRLEVSTGNVARVSADDLNADRAGAPRGIIVGESPETGLVSDGYGQVFAVERARLVPMQSSLAPDDPYNSPTPAFDTGTRKPLWFRVPTGYEGGADEFTAFEWLDDDQLALMNAANSWRQRTAEILVCRVSTRRCELVVAAKSGDRPRIAPHLGLPG